MSYVFVALKHSNVRSFQLFLHSFCCARFIAKTNMNFNNLELIYQQTYQQLT